MSRRLPIYIAIDTSGSMNGEPILSVNVGLQAMIHALRQDPHALETVHLSLVTFDNTVQEIFPLTALEAVQIPEISCPRSGATNLGAALALVTSRMEEETIKSAADKKRDWRPMLFLMTDGSPSDTALFNEMVIKIRQHDFGKIIACAAGPKAKESFLKQITDVVVSLDTTDSASFSNFFKWVSASVEQSSVGIGAGTDYSNHLPPPPDEIQIVI
ncbi:MAG: VWA domain-containing protein [Methylococcales bacterium]|nr:VWA domain-containing protein [Methylococcales bacterium]